MTDINKERNYPKYVKKLNVIKKLKEYKEHDKIKNLLKEYEKKQESDFFLIPNNIKIGKIKTYRQKLSCNTPLRHFASSNILNHTSKKKITTYQNTIIKYKSGNLLSTSKIERIKNKDTLNINKNHVIDNKSLKNFFNEARKRINQEKSKNEENNKFLLECPYPIRKSLINQENIIRKIIKEKKFKKRMQEKIKKKM